MSRYQSLAVIALGAALVIGQANSADALSVEVKRQNAGNGVVGTFGQPGEQWYRTANTSLNNVGRNVYAGLFRLTDKEPPVGSVSVLGDFVAFCVELGSALKLPQSYTPDADPFTPAVTTKIDRLWTNAYEEVDDADTAAAFQLALWNTIYDTDSEVTSGLFKVTNKNLSAAFIVQADAWLDRMDGVGNDDWTETAGAFTFLERNGAGQNLIAPVPVPVPAAVWMIGTGLLGLFSLRRRSVG